MKKTVYLFILSSLALSCRHSINIDAKITDIKKIEYIQCYSLEDVFDGFLKFNDIAKKDTFGLDLYPASDIAQYSIKSIKNHARDYPLFSVFEPWGFFDGDFKMYLGSSFLGVISNNKKNLLLSQLSDTLIRAGFPANINFFYIPSPFVDTMSVLIGSKTKNYTGNINTENLSAFGFQKMKSFGFKGKPLPISEDPKFMPYIVFKETSKNLFSSGEYIIKLTLKDTVLYKSIDKDIMKTDTVFFDDFFTGEYINDKLK